MYQVPVITYFEVREGFEAFRCDVWSKVQRHKKAPKAGVVHPYPGPVCNIRGSPDRQQWLRGGIIKVLECKEKKGLEAW